jgi:hypothetical protein
MAPGSLIPGSCRSRGRFSTVTCIPPGAAKREIDARGLVVAPGFIDIHSHSDFLLLEDGSAPSKVRQGVTTEVLGEGRSAGPWTGKARRRELADGKVSWERLAGYFDRLEKSGTAVNVASYVGLDNVWQAVMGESHDRPTSEQIDQMKVILDDAMKDGAFGLSTMLAMPPGSLATTDDLVELTKVVAKHGGIYSTHNRHEGTGVFEEIEDSTGDEARPLFSLEDAVARVRAARLAIDRAGGDVLLVGRAEGFLHGRPDLDEAVARLKAYADAGADCLYAPGLKTREQIVAVVEAVAPRPVNVLVGGASEWTVDALASLGVRRISVGGALARAAWGGMLRAARMLHDQGRFDAFADAANGKELNGFFEEDFAQRF